MGTRSSITVKHPTTGQYHNIYCHWDGYTINNGALLIEHYNSLTLALALVSPGDMSSLREKCNGEEGHTFDSPNEGQTVYYGRDRGEDGCEMRIYDTYLECLEKNDQEYNYLFADDKWYVSCHSDKYTVLETIMEHHAKGEGTEFDVEAACTGASVLYSKDL